MSIVVETINDDQADPRYLRYMQARSALAMLAGQLARDGLMRAAFAILDGLGAMPIDLPGLPKRKAR